MSTCDAARATHYLHTSQQRAGTSITNLPPGREWLASATWRRAHFVLPRRLGGNMARSSRSYFLHASRTARFARYIADRLSSLSTFCTFASAVISVRERCKGVFRAGRAPLSLAMSSSSFSFMARSESLGVATGNPSAVA